MRETDAGSADIADTVSWNCQRAEYDKFSDVGRMTIKEYNKKYRETLKEIGYNWLGFLIFIGLMYFVMMILQGRVI